MDQRAHPDVGVAQDDVEVRETSCRPPADPNPGPAPESGDPRVLKVMVVDDNRDSADTMALLLDAIGFTVEKAHDGLSALELAGELRPDVVLLDIGLPGLDGFQVARRLRDTYGDEPLLLALTGYGDEQSRRRSSDVGFDHHLLKPVDLAILERLIAEHVRARRSA